MAIDDGTVISQSAIDQERAREEKWSKGLEPATRGMPVPTPIRGERPVEAGSPDYEGKHQMNDGQPHSTRPGEIVKHSGQRERVFDRNSGVGSKATESPAIRGR